jgi:hypothetical protein
MTNLTRRVALKKIAGFSLGAIAAPLMPGIIGCSRAQRPITLNVVLHGLYVLNFTNLGIELFTPFMEEHIYRAGNWEWRSLEHLRSGGSYQLRGTDYRATTPKLDLNCNILVTNSYFSARVHPEQSMYVVNLPFPETISLLRTVDDGVNQPCPEQKTIIIKRLSLCQVLSYHVPNVDDLELHGTNWKPKVDPLTNTANLHFWAEPLLRVPRQHACNAYARLSDLLEPLTLKIGTDKTAPLDPDTGVLGLPREQEQGLSEWQSGGEGSHVTNCTTVMFALQTL